MNKESSSDLSSNKTRGHQGVGTTGGINAELRVLLCTNVDLSLDYEGIYQVMKRFGTINRIKLKISGNKSFDCYTTFDNSSSANLACKELRGHNLNGSILGTKLYNSKNLDNEDFDFVPKILDRSEAKSTERNPPIAT